MVTKNRARRIAKNIAGGRTTRVKPAELGMVVSLLESEGFRVQRQSLGGELGFLVSVSNPVDDVGGLLTG